MGAAQLPERCFSPDLRSLWALSTWPKLLGWYSGVYATNVPRSSCSLVHSAAVNVDPLSDVVVSGRPNRRDTGLNEGLAAVIRSGLGHWDRVEEPRGPIEYGQEIPVAIMGPGQRPNNIQLQISKPPRQNWSVVCGRSY